MCPPVHPWILPSLVRVCKEGEGSGPGVWAWRGARRSPLSKSCLLSGRDEGGWDQWAIWGGAVPRWHVQTGASFRGRDCRGRILSLGPLGSAAAVKLKILGLLRPKILLLTSKSVLWPFSLFLPFSPTILKPNLKQKEKKWKNKTKKCGQNQW